MGGETDPICDHYALTISLGEGARIQIAVKTSSPSAEGGLPFDDYDVFVYAPNGALVAEDSSPAGSATAEFRHRKQHNGRPYEVRISPWLVLPGSTYKGTAKALTLGR